MATNTIVTPGTNANETTTMLVPQESDMTSMSNAIIEWRRLTDENKEYKQAIRERSKKIKALEAVILRVMKNHNIGALDLKNSGGRVLFKRSKRQTGMGPKNLQKYLVDYFKSEQKANEAIEFIQKSRETFFKESLLLEKGDTAEGDA